MQNDNAKFKNHSDFVGIPKFYILIFTFYIYTLSPTPPSFLFTPSIGTVK